MSAALSDFLEEIVLSDDTRLSEKAYRMDTGGASGKSMRARAGLGAVHCCDYLHISNNGFVLIEDTHLDAKIREMFDELHALGGDKNLQKKTIRNRIRQENCLKVYGSMLVLCRLKQWSENFAFWLVACDNPAWPKAEYNLMHGEIEKSLSDQLMGAQLAESVQVMSVAGLRDLLKNSVG